MTDNNQDSSGYEPYEEQQPVRNLLNSLLLPNAALLSQFSGSWPAGSTWNNGQNENDYQGYSNNPVWASHSYDPEQEDSNGDDFYSPATPPAMQAPNNGHAFTEHKLQPSTPHSSGEEIPTTESINQAAVQRNQSLPNVSTPATGSSKLDTKRAIMDTIAPSERALELKRQLLAKKNRVPGTATPEKSEVKSSSPALTDRKSAGAKDKTPKQQMTGSNGVSNKIMEPSRSATIFARLEEMKSLTKPKHQILGLEPSIPEKSSKSPNRIAVNGHSTASHEQPMQSPRRTDSSMTLDDLLAEERVKAVRTSGRSRSVGGATGDPNLEAKPTDQMTLPTSTVPDKTTRAEDETCHTFDHKTGSASAESSEQGEIHEEPAGAIPSQVKPLQIPSKPGNNPSNFKNKVQPPVTMQPKKGGGCYECHKYFDHGEDLDDHVKVVHGKIQREKRNVEKIFSREDHRRTDLRSRRDEIFRPERPSRPWIDRRYSDDRYDRAPESRSFRDTSSRDRLPDLSKGRQADVDGEARRDPSPKRTLPQSKPLTVRPAAGKEREIDEMPRDQKNPSTSKRSTGVLPPQVEEWLRMTDFYDLDESKREAKLERWRRQRAISEERERLELEEQRERAEIAQAKAKAKFEKLACAASTLPADREHDISGAVALPKLRHEIVSLPMLPPAVPIVPDDDIGMRIKDSAMRSAETSPTQPSFPPTNSQSLTSSPSLKRRFSTNNQSPNGQPAEKLARLDTDVRGGGPTADEPYSATRIHPMDLDEPQSRDLSPRGGERHHFRSRSPVRRRDSDFHVQYGDVIDDRVPFPSRDASREGRYEDGRYESWRPFDSNSNERARDRKFDGRPRGGNERRDYQPPGGRGYRGGRGGGYQRGYAPRGGRGRNNDDRERG